MSKNLNIILIEDDDFFVSAWENLSDNIVLKYFSGPKEFLKFTSTDIFDLVGVDVIVIDENFDNSNINGVELAAIIRSWSFPCVLASYSSSPSHDSKDSPFDLVLPKKPSVALSKIREHLRGKSNRLAENSKNRFQQESEFGQDSSYRSKRDLLAGMSRVEVLIDEVYNNLQGSQVLKMKQLVQSMRDEVGRLSST